MHRPGAGCGGMAIREPLVMHEESSDMRAQLIDLSHRAIIHGRMIRSEPGSRVCVSDAAMAEWQRSLRAQSRSDGDEPDVSEPAPKFDRSVA
jgi:hypothetical protein